MSDLIPSPRAQALLDGAPDLAAIRASAVSAAANGEWDVPLGSMVLPCSDVLALLDDISELRATLAAEQLPVRPEVRAFALAMERKLRHHDAKKGAQGWKGADPNYLLRLLHEEGRELDRAVMAVLGAYRGLTPADVIDEAADVGNLAMMLADVVGGLMGDASLPPAGAR